MERLPLETQTVYAELVEQLTAIEGARGLGSTPGSFVTKTVKGQQYSYFQYVDASGSKQQVYLGRRDGALDALAARFAEKRAYRAPDYTSVQRLASLARVGGAAVTDTPSARVMKGLADAGVFRSGGVLVGTHAFVVLGNLLGVRWASAGMRTQDVDVAAARVLEIAAPAASVDVPGVTDSLEMGFLPRPGLDPASPSTSFKIRGQALRIDLLTPSRTANPRPVRIPRFAAAAQPLEYLDYLIENPVRAAIVAGDPALVSVPDPARFALHKLIVASDRPAASTMKREKDLAQAGQVLETLLADREADVVLAWEALCERGAQWVERARAQATRLSPEAADALQALMKEKT